MHHNLTTYLYIIDKKFKEVFEYRFKNYDDFQTLVEAGVNEYSKGYEGTIYAFLPEERKYRKEDLDKYEIELQKRISEKKFTRLSILPRKEDSKYRQGYRVE